jgi:hypothetical protein
VPVGVLGKVVHDHGDDEEDHRARQDGREDEEVAEPVHLCGTEHRDERSRPGRGVQGMSELQYRDRRRDSQRPGEADMRLRAPCTPSRRRGPPATARRQGCGVARNRNEEPRRGARRTRRTIR